MLEIEISQADAKIIQTHTMHFIFIFIFVF